MRVLWKCFVIWSTSLRIAICFGFFVAYCCCCCTHIFAFNYGVCLVCGTLKKAYSHLSKTKFFLIISLKYNIYEFVSKNNCNNINVSFCVLLKKKRTQFDFMLTKNVLVVKQTTTILLFDRGLISPITPPLFS